MKFKKNDIAYIVTKQSFSTTEYTKCEILYAYEYKNNESIVINNYTVVIGERIKPSNNTSVWYPQYTEDKLISLKEYRLIKLKNIHKINENCHT